MLKFLIKTTTEYRVETESDANSLHEELEQFCKEKEYTLTSWNQNYKCRKQKGEIIEEYYQVKATIQFNDIKEPELPLNNIIYEMGTKYE